MAFIDYNFAIFSAEYASNTPPIMLSILRFLSQQYYFAVIQFNPSNILRCIHYFPYPAIICGGWFYSFELGAPIHRSVCDCWLAWGHPQHLLTTSLSCLLLMLLQPPRLLLSLLLLPILQSPWLILMRMQPHDCSPIHPSTNL